MINSIVDFIYTTNVADIVLAALIAFIVVKKIT